MNKILETLTEEIKELFPDNISEKRISDELKNLKSFQGSLAPDSEFRENLKSRLEGIYTIEHGAEVSRFSFLRYMSVVTSFILVVGVGYIVYDVNQSPIQTVLEQESVSELPEINEVENSNDSALEIKNKILQKSVNNEDIGINISGGEDQNNIKNSEQSGFQNIESTTSARNDEVTEKKENTQEELPIKKEITPSKTEEVDNDIVIPEDGRMQKEPEIIPKIVEDDEIDNDNLNQNIESGDSPSVEPSMMMDAIMPDENILETSVPNMFRAEDSQAIYQGKIQSFKEVCEEYNGLISDTGEACTLEDGKQCTMENIHSCALTGSGGINLGGSEDEVFLQELIDEFGQ